MTDNVEDYRTPRVWWCPLNREAFDPLFESRDAAIMYYGASTRLMRIIEQPSGCEDA